MIDATRGRPLPPAAALGRALARVPRSVQTKLLIAFVGTVGLLVIVGLLGLRVLSEANDRVADLGSLQQRATKYRELQTDALQLRLLLTLRAGGGNLVYVGADPSSAPTGPALRAIDQTTVVTTLQRFGSDIAQLGFAPPPGEQRTIARIADDHASFSAVMSSIADLDQNGRSAEGLDLQRTRAEPIAEDLKALTETLATTTQAETDRTIAENASSFAASRGLFVAVAAGSILLALLLGYLLSRSVVRPIRRMESRLTAIASGDFSGHVEVAGRDELGSLASNINAMNDELGRLYLELDAASRHKSEFLANMSHELRTPLNAIIGFSQVLRQQMFGELNDKQSEYLDDVLASGQHLLSLINDILDLSKVEAGRMDLQPSRFDLPAVLMNGLTMVRERATRQGVALDASIDAGLGLIEADERKVKQIVFNLLTNAVKFTPEGGRVTLVARPMGDEVEIRVVDTGIGIAPEDRARIFDEFYQVARPTSHEGTGLGLALTRRLVELHHGSLSVDSAPGDGSTFVVRLPVRQPSPLAAPGPAVLEGSVAR